MVFVLTGWGISGIIVSEAPLELYFSSFAKLRLTISRIEGPNTCRGSDFVRLESTGCQVPV